jgi:putative ABC transport system permease protein
VAGELALAMMLLVGAGLMLRSLGAMRAADPGFAPEHALTMTLTLPKDRYADAGRQAAVLEQARTRVASLGGIRHAAFINHLHVGGDTWGTRLTIEGAPAPEPGGESRASFRIVTPDYFRAAGIRQLAGRDVTSADTSGAPLVAVVNRTFVQRHLGGVEAIGSRLRMGPPDGDDPWTTIVGVVADVRQGSLRDGVEPEIFLPYGQNPVAFYTSATLVARTDGDPMRSRRDVEAVLRETEPDAPVTDVMTLEQVLERSLTSARLGGGLLAAFAAAAIALAALGLYGVISFSVTRRTREFGIRIALGANRRRVIALVLRQGLVVVAAGAPAGLAGAILLARLLRGSLYAVSPTDVSTYAGVAALLVAIALAASAIPAVRVSRVDPIRALRQD